MKTPGLDELIFNETPRDSKFTPKDWNTHSNLVTQTRVRSFPNPEGDPDPYATYKFVNVLRLIPEDAVDTGRVESDTVSVGDVGESSPGILSSDSGILSPGTRVYTLKPLPPPPSPAHTRASGKAKKE